MKNDALMIFKVLADDTRLRILQALREKDMYVELLSERLSLTPPTISFHLKKLQDAGLVDARREQYYIVYSLRKEAFGISLSELLFSAEDSKVAGDLREEQYRRKVLKSFMPDGYCKALPAQIKKRMIIYEEIFRRFDPSRSYTEPEVNEVIGQVHEDFCSVRRDFIGLGWMHRKDGVYYIDR